MRHVGFATGYDARQGVRDMARSLRDAEERGFDTALFSETVFALRDSVSALATFAGATRSLALGTVQVARLRTPLLMAQTIATLDELSEGRLFIAIGAYIALHSRIHGLAPADPPGALTEWIECIRLFLTGAPVTYHGRYVQFDNISLGFKPARSSVPIYVAATSRTGLRLAGRLGDGVLLNSIASPAYTRNALDVVRDALAEAGRDASSFRVAQIVNCSVDDDESAALDAVRWEIATKLRPLAYASSIPSRLHVGEPVLKAIDIERLHAVHAEGGDAAMSAAIPESVLRGLTASGTREAVRERVEEYRAAGVETPILRPASAEQTERVLNLFATH